MKKLLPWVLVAALAAWAVGTLFQKPKPGFNLAEFGRLPALLNGRIQPLDSVGRNALLQIRAKQSAPVKLHFSVFDPAKRGQLMGPTEWLLEVMARPDVADTRKVFRIDHPEVVALLKLPEKDPDAGEDGMHFAFDQLRDRLDRVSKEVERIQAIEPAHRNAFEKQVMKLQNALLLYQRLKVTLRPPTSDDFAAELADFEQNLKAGLAAVEARERGEQYDAALLGRFVRQFNGFSSMAQYAYPLVVPPGSGAAREAWQSAGTNLMSAVHGAPISPAVKHYATMVSAFAQGDPGRFNDALREYGQFLRASFQAEARKGAREFFYNQLQAFYKALTIYVLAFVLACVSWFNGSVLLRRSAVGLVGLAVVLHTVGILFRMVLEGRPPVTNLYSSAIFIGWGAALLGLALERIYRDGLGSAIASLAGFTTLVIAHNLSLSGDTMEMLRAVLDTNFWLATHVITITLGYSACFVAGLLAIFYILRGVLTPSLSAERAKALARMVYGVICFATLFSFIGTVLGGIWADQSWGRFWGWDPKENGALLIVLWCAAILHARWGGWIRERGLMNMAIFGNIVTAFSWFGVNMLGVGLHSYGFMDSAFVWLVAFTLSQLALIGLGLLPLAQWRSFRAGAATGLAHGSGPAPAGA